MGKPSTAAQNRYIAKAYDRVNLTLPKGRKEEVKAHAEQRGESLNGFIQRAIDETMQRDDTPASDTTERDGEYHA
ncbi:hypothetical protein [Butyricicoccus porcorum]|uniref:Arc-like DNA binding domain-containing protein n=1 Tax=Butyricicoccus porcorum TaxID=1945634 RepID=A0A252F7I7_9FIRM|nr:hypothetical protein [Butyricicoccus porcorum]OUM21682.1 hypothetical protein CBW42_00160 [Butyricicoccus porcorum]